MCVFCLRELCKRYHDAVSKYSRSTTNTTARKYVMLTHCSLLNRELPWEDILPSMQMQLQMNGRQKCIIKNQIIWFRCQNFQNSINFSYAYNYTLREVGILASLDHQQIASV